MSLSLPLATASKDQADSVLSDCRQRPGEISVHLVLNSPPPCPRTLVFSLILHAFHQNEIHSREVFSGGSFYSRVNQILILLIFGNKTMFKTIPISKAIWWGVPAAPHSIVAPLIYSLKGAVVHLQNHYSQSVLNM